MQLKIDGQTQTFTPLKTFRKQWGLPPEFSVDYFERKDWDGLGRLDGAGNQALAELQERLVAGVWGAIGVTHLLSEVDALSRAFQRGFEQANEHIQLRQVEIDYAVSGFNDVLHSMAYALIRLYHLHKGDPAQIEAGFDAPALYDEWLDSTVRLAADTHIYPHDGREFAARVVLNAYGRVGMVVSVDDQRHYVMDTTLACPAISYMRILLVAVGEAVCAALLRSVVE